MAAVALRGVRKAFGASAVLEGIDAEIAPGEFVVLVGPSGAGKTTLLRLIAGLERPSAGEVRIDGRVVNDVAPKDRDVAMVFQHYALYPHLNVRDNLAFSLRMRGEKAARIAERVAQAAALLGLEDKLSHFPSQLSGGQQQRVAIGRALVRQPRVFLFDEPLASLDPMLRTQMRTELKGLHRRVGATSIHVTHDQGEAMALADRLIVLRDGRLEQSGTPLQLYDRPATLFVARFIGAPPMNLLPAALFGDARARVYGFRPEACTLDPHDGLQAHVIHVEHLGAAQHVYLQVHGVQACAVTAERRDWREGDAVRLRPDPARLLQFDAHTGRRL